jgi:hypothetical protein
MDHQQNQIYEFLWVLKLLLIYIWSTKSRSKVGKQKGGKLKIQINSLQLFGTEGEKRVIHFSC